MSAYRRLNRSSKSTTLQHVSMSAYQSHHHSNHLNATETTTMTNSNFIDGGTDDRQLSNNATYPTQPKHLRFPDASFHSEVLNELIMFGFSVIATAMQFLHLYRTIWWVPESHTSQSMVSVWQYSMFMMLIAKTNGYFIYCRISI